MPILNINDTPPTNVGGSYRTQQELQTSTLFDKELPVSKINYQVDGMRWTVGYFNQILNVNSQPKAPDINLPNGSMAYNRIEKLDIYVSSGLPTDAVANITGNGVINAGFVPHVGDAFTATLAGGRIGIFVLTAVTKEYYNTHDIFAVDYKLTYFADTSADMYNDLIYKTARTYVYDKDAINTFSTPVLLATDYKKRIDMAAKPAEIMKQYVDIFLNNRTKALQMPTVTSVYVDQLVSEFIFKIISVNDVPELIDAARITRSLPLITIWDALLDRDVTLLDKCSNDLKYGINNVGSSDAKLATYLGVEYMITDRTGLPTVTPNPKTNPMASRKVVVSPITDPSGSYVFSVDFYNQNSSVTFTDFETAVLEYLKGGIPNRVIVETAINEYMYWSYDVQYVAVPILVLLAKSLASDVYSAV